MKYSKIKENIKSKMIQTDWDKLKLKIGKLNDTAG